MMESIHRFGDSARLGGILATPAATAENMPVAFIFITAGLVHKPGPHRLYVDLSRAFAAAGFPALRFDLSGIGESEPAAANTSGAERAVIADTRAAMDAVTAETGCNTFVLIGLCSGAEVAHMTALADARVAGVILLDGYIPRTPHFWVSHYLPRLLSARKWQAFLAARMRRTWQAITRRHDASTDRSDVNAQAFWEALWPTRDELAAQHQALADRGIRQLLVFSGGSGYCSYAEQFDDAFADVDFRDTKTVHYLRDADHMYILGVDRRRLVHLVLQWVRRNFAVPNACTRLNRSRMELPNRLTAGSVMTRRMHARDPSTESTTGRPCE